VEEILSPRKVELAYDITAWRADGMPRGVGIYRLIEPQEFEFRLSEEGRHGLGSALQVWTTELKGLTKLMKRIRVAWQVAECRVVGPEVFRFKAAGASAGFHGGHEEFGTSGD
jgi:hypothetical protein